MLGWLGSKGKKYSIRIILKKRRRVTQAALENCFLILFLRHTITVEGILEQLDAAVEVKQSKSATILWPTTFKKILSGQAQSGTAQHGLKACTGHKQNYL